ncbi:MAG: hypothetical protein ACI4TM_06260 [Candidatus Cryptobacteroides sp.]
MNGRRLWRDAVTNSRKHAPAQKNSRTCTWYSADINTKLWQEFDVKNTRIAVLTLLRCKKL